MQDEDQSIRLEHTKKYAQISIYCWICIYFCLLLVFPFILMTILFACGMILFFLMWYRYANKKKIEEYYYGFTFHSSTYPHPLDLNCLSFKEIEIIKEPEEVIHTIKEQNKQHFHLRNYLINLPYLDDSRISFFRDLNPDLFVRIRVEPIKTLNSIFMFFTGNPDAAFCLIEEMRDDIKDDEYDDKSYQKRSNELFDFIFAKLRATLQGDSAEKIPFSPPYLRTLFALYPQHHTLFQTDILANPNFIQRIKYMEILDSLLRVSTPTQMDLLL